MPFHFNFLKFITKKLKPIDADELKQLRDWVEAIDLKELQAWFTKNPGRLNITYPLELPGHQMNVGNNLLRYALQPYHKNHHEDREEVAFDPAILECLIAHGALSDLNKQGELKGESDSILISAIRLNRVDIVDFFLKQGCNVNTSNPRRFSPLSIAAHDGALNSLKILIARGASLDRRDEPWGRTALMLATHQNHWDIVKELSQSGADFLLKNQDGDTAFSIAKKGNKHQLAEYILSLQEEKQLADIVRSSDTPPSPKIKGSGAFRL